MDSKQEKSAFIQAVSQNHGTKFTSLFNLGVVVVVLLALAVSIIIASFQRSRFEAELLYREMPEIIKVIASADDISAISLDHLLNDSIRFIGIQKDNTLLALAGTPPTGGVSLIPITDFFRPQLKLKNFISFVNLVKDDVPENRYFTSFPGFDRAIIGTSPITYKRKLILFFLGFSALSTSFLMMVYIFARWLLWRNLSYPLNMLVETINAFSIDPTIARPLPRSVVHSHEFKHAAKALDHLQRSTMFALRQRERLADIGEAVTKINHDIRNVLSSATLVADALIASDDPKVRRSAPHVVRSLEQAVDLCQSMLDYLVEVPPPKPEIVQMDDVVDMLKSSSGLEVDYIGPDEIFVDDKILSRILINLSRNARIAGATDLQIDIWRAGHLGVVDILDNGPGITEKERTRLFQPFKSTKTGGTGLGLAIARDLAVAHGGNLKLTRSNAQGSEFRLQLPDNIFV